MTLEEFFKSKKIVVPYNIRLSSYGGDQHSLLDLMKEFASLEGKESFEAGRERIVMGMPQEITYSSDGVVLNTKNYKYLDFESYNNK